MPINLPILLTWLRIVAIPLLIAVYFLPTGWATPHERDFAATWIFVAAAITDWADGYLARKLDQTSAFGAFLDPVADKLMVAAALIVLVQLGRTDAIGATKMDRPEDIQPNGVTGKVYVMLTNNTKRKDDQVDAANPRAKNAFGHIIEIIEDGGDFTATKGKWEVLLKCGDPSVAEVGASFSTATSANGWFGMPDNCAVDSAGRLWVSTDGNNAKDTGRTDGLWAVDTEGEARATSKLFFRVPVGAEMCGPLFTPNDETAFVAVQHPGDGGEEWEGFGRPSYYEDLSTRWPDFKPDMPVRPGVVVITKQGGGKIAV